jgi:HEAT repeat protein
VLPLRDALSDTQFSARRLAARSLGILGDPRAVEPLVSLLSDPHRNVRQDAVDALALLADQRAIPALEQAAVHDKNQGVRQRAARA